MRRKWVYDKDVGEMVEVTAERISPVDTRTDALWGDRHYDGLQAPDGADISSRKKHREYMKRMGYATVDDFKESWAKAKEEREHYMKNGGSVRRSDIVEAIRQLERR